MISSVGGDVKPLALSSSSFFQQSNRRGGNCPKRVGEVSFPGSVVYLSRITHHSYHGLWVGYSKFINGPIVAASGALGC